MRQVSSLVPLLTKQSLQARVQASTRSVKTERILDALRDVLADDRAYDVFLSHSYLDSESVLGLKLLLEEFGLKVYVDWYDDPELDRTAVTAETAAHLKKRMRSSKVLLYAISEHALGSRWTPWEIGFFDGINGNVAIVPVRDNGVEVDYRGQEYLGLYPYVSESIGVSASNWMTPEGLTLWFVDKLGEEKRYRNLGDWLPGGRFRT